MDANNGNSSMIRLKSTGCRYEVGGWPITGHLLSGEGTLGSNPRICCSLLTRWMYCLHVMKPAVFCLWVFLSSSWRIDDKCFVAVRQARRNTERSRGSYQTHFGQPISIAQSKPHWAYHSTVQHPMMPRGRGYYSRVSF